MGIHERAGTWKSRAENNLVRAESADSTFGDLVERSRGQAFNFAQAKENANQVKVFISAGHRDKVLEADNQMSAAKSIVRNEPHFIPEIIDDIDEQAAYIVALSEELTKPEYNQ